MKRSRGVTLVETLLGIMIATAVLGLLTIVTSRMLSANRASHDHLQTVATLARLGEQLRDDVHQASGVATGESLEHGPRLTLDGPAERRIEYEITPAGLTRVARVAGEVQAREQFTLPSMTFVGWQNDSAHGLVSLIVGRQQRPGAGDAGRASEFAITAALDRANAPQPAPTGD